jgi:D,D-heptose 1,7-bisphosphate phosphatase
MNKAVFFDRDGIVNFREVGGYIQTPENFHICEDFIASLKCAKKNGFLAVLVTNQQGIGKGVMTAEQLDKLHSYMQEKLKAETGYKFDAIYYCPDLKNTGSKCRKPEPGMLLKAAEELDIDLSKSWMIGDRPSDILAGKAAGTKTILVGLQEPGPDCKPDYRVMNLIEASKRILIER